jgi:hypothetical protein
VQGECRGRREEGEGPHFSIYTRHVCGWRGGTLSILGKYLPWRGPLRCCGRSIGCPKYSRALVSSLWHPFPSLPPPHPRNATRRFSFLFFPSSTSNPAPPIFLPPFYFSPSFLPSSSPIVLLPLPLSPLAPTYEIRIKLFRSLRRIFRQQFQNVALVPRIVIMQLRQKMYDRGFWDFVPT